MKQGEEVKENEVARRYTAGGTIVGDAIFYAVLVLIVLGLFFYLGREESGPRTFMGFSAMRVLTSSMQSEIPKGSLVIIRSVDPGTLKTGDDITFLVSDTTTYTHRIIEIHENYMDTGIRGFQTKGVMNASPDKEIVPAGNIVGKVVFHNLLLGNIAGFIKNHLLLTAIFGAMFIGLVACVRIALARDEDEEETDEDIYGYKESA